MKYKFGLTENIATNLVFIDGITRCGKSIFSSIISSYEDMEHIQFLNQLETIIPSVMLGGIDKDCAKALLRLIFNELSYDLQLSRNVNFRPGDQTGVEKYKQPEIYHQRLKLEEGDEIVEYIRNNDISIPFQTHDMMVNLDILDEMDINYKIIELYRNPIDNLYSWWTRGWGERFGNDPRGFTLLISHKNKALPWYCAGYEDQVIDLNPYEACCVIGMDLIKRSIEKHSNALHPEKILMTTFEDMVQTPDKELLRIEKFINRKMTSYTPGFVSEARCPRVLKQEDREKKLAVFKENVDTSIFNQLVALAEDYEKDTYGLSLLS